MGLLGKPSGVFSLDESDRFVGSFISKDDVKAILNVNDDDLKDVAFTEINNALYIDETSLRKEYWEKGLIPNASPCKKGNATISFDEYILIKIIERTYPSAKVDSQFKWGRKYIDIFVDFGDKKCFIEFHGPGHFSKRIGRRDIGQPENPFIRKTQIEQEYGYPCYIWPYWIQRCSSNLKILLGDAKPTDRGYGALWSTKVFFGDFSFDNSAQIIEEITKQFKAAPNGEYGYFYEKWDDSNYGRIKEEHPIIKRIINGKKSIEQLIPNGADTKESWLPRCLWDRIKEL